MQDDLNGLSEKTTNDSAPESDDFENESLSGQDIPKAIPGEIKDFEEPFEPASFAQWLQVIREKTMEQVREFKKNLKIVEERDPALIKKIKLASVGVVILLLVFAAVIIRNNKAGEVSVETPAGIEDKAKAAQEANDKLRRDNLSNIVRLAAVYHLEQKADLPVSAAYVKLNEDNPVTEYLWDALTKYGASAEILLDPKNPDYYYAYRSADGKTIELSARLENEAGEYCVSGTSPCIYKKMITETEMAVMSENLESYK